MECYNTSCVYHDQMKCGRVTYHVKSANCRDREKDCDSSLKCSVLELIDAKSYSRQIVAGRKKSYKTISKQSH